MGTIINVTNKDVYVKEKAVYYKLSKELFMFEPKIGYQIKVLKTSDNRVIKILLINREIQEANLEKGTRFLRITGIYNIIIGALLLVLLSEKNPNINDYFSKILLMAVGVFIVGILLTSLKNNKAKFLLANITTIFFVIMLIIGVILLFTNREKSGLILMSSCLVPLAFNSLYFIFYNKSDNVIPKTFPYIRKQ